MKKSLQLLIPLMLMLSCTKQEVITVPNNKPPADNSVSDITISNYVNRLYINLLARKATTAEFDDAFSRIKADPHSVSVREELVKELMTDPYYLLNITQRCRNDYIEGVDTAMMKRDLVIYYGLYNDPQYASFKEKLAQDIINLQELIRLDDKFLGDSINTVGVHKICINNIYYDQVNMGTENFVVSMFQHFFDRYPTSNELASAKLMTDGVSSSVFLQTGDSKDDFIKIFFESDNYFEGQVYILFKQFLYRNPTQAEAVALATEYKKTKDYRALQRSILTTDEFFNQ